MTALQRFGFKTRKDGSLRYIVTQRKSRDALSYPTEQRMVGLGLSSCAGGVGGVHHFSNRASNPEAIRSAIHFRLACRSKQHLRGKKDR